MVKVIAIYLALWSRSNVDQGQSLMSRSEVASSQSQMYGTSRHIEVDSSIRGSPCLVQPKGISLKFGVSVIRGRMSIIWQTQSISFLFYNKETNVNFYLFISKDTYNHSSVI